MSSRETPPVGDERDSADKLETPDEHRMTSVRLDPVFRRAWSLMQEGQWRDAAEMLATLEDRYPDSAELRDARHFLALRLSAEKSWSDGPDDQLQVLRVPAIQGLVIANLLLYFMLAILCLATK